MGSTDLPNGMACSVETLTNNKNRTAANVRAALSKGNGNMGTTGCVYVLSDKKGQMIIEKESTEMDEDELMMLAIEAGADDFEAEDEGYTVLTTPEAFGEVCKALETAGVEMASAEVTMIPQTSATLDETNVKAWEKMMSLLEEDDDVQDIYHNCEEE